MRETAVTATARVREPSQRASAVIGAGALAGLLAGAVMAAVMVLAAAVNGRPPLRPLAAMGQTFVGPEGLAGAAQVLYGVALHLAVSALLGVPLAPLLSRDSTVGRSTFIGMGYSLAVMAVMTSLVLPAVNPGLRAAMPALGGSWVIAHALHGAVLGFSAVWLRRRFASRAAGRSGTVDRARPPAAPPGVGQRPREA